MINYVSRLYLSKVYPTLYLLLMYKYIPQVSLQRLPVRQSALLVLRRLQD